MPRVALATVISLLGWALAHTQPGVHEQLLENEPAGPYLVDLYGWPTVGDSVFEVDVDGTRGERVNGDAQVRLEVGRFREAALTEVAAERSGEGLEAQVPISQAGQWWLRIMIEGPQGYAETTTRLTAHPARENNSAAQLVLLGLLPLAAVGVTLLILRATHVPVFERVRADA